MGVEQFRGAYAIVTYDAANARECEFEALRCWSARKK